jgi:hypothetical protein
MIANMSQHNQNAGYQQSYNIPTPNQYYGGQIPVLHIDAVQPQQGTFPQRPQSTQHVRSQRSSSSASLHTRGFDRMSHRATNLSPLDNAIGPQLPRGFDLLDPDYARSYHGSNAGRAPEPAWSPYNLRQSQSSGAHGLSPQSSANFRSPWGPGSDIGSQALASDEGYFSGNTRSVISNEPDHVNQELSASFMSNVNNMHVGSVASEAPTMSRVPSDQRSHLSRSSARSKRDFPCLECSEVLKCKSEFKCVCGITIRWPCADEK